jgi:hypothetical protein
VGTRPHGGAHGFHLKPLPTHGECPPEGRGGRRDRTGPPRVRGWQKPYRWFRRRRGRRHQPRPSGAAPRGPRAG